jgi:hypothetical protein
MATLLGPRLFLLFKPSNVSPTSYTGNWSVSKSNFIIIQNDGIIQDGVKGTI